MPDKFAKPRHQQVGCRLLRLPSELRLHIYELLLGGRLIHVADPVDPRVKRKHHFINTCCAGVSDERIAAASRPKRAGWFSNRHKDCGSEAVFHGGELNILKVCQQIYDEAATLPFKANTFAVRSPQEVWRLVDNLLPKQQSAIESMVIYETNRRRNWEIASAIPLERLTLRLQGLRQLSIRIELCPNNHDKRKPGHVTNARNRSALMAGLSPFAQCGLSKVEVIVIDITSFSDRSLSPAAVDAWKEEITQMLLPVGRDGRVG